MINEQKYKVLLLYKKQPLDSMKFADMKIFLKKKKSYSKTNKFAKSLFYVNVSQHGGKISKDNYASCQSDRLRDIYKLATKVAKTDNNLQSFIPL